MRVTAQLLDAATGHILWSDKIDLLSRDLLDVQDEIAERLLAGLKLRLTAEEQEQIERPLTHSPEAYEFYLRGRDALFRYLLRTHEEADLDQAVKMMHEAIGLDPEFARAHATLGRCYVLYAQGWGGAENFVLAERSLQATPSPSTPTIVNARLQMVYVDMHHGDKDKAHARVEELLQEAPGRPVGPLRGRAWSTAWTACTSGPSRLYDRLLEVNPKDLVLVAFNKARIFTHQGRFEEAVAEIERGRAAEPEHPLLKTFLAVALFNQGMVDDAQALARGRAPPEPALRRRPAPARLVPVRPRPARAGPRPRHRPRARDRHRRPRHRVLARLVLRDGGHGRGGARVARASRCRIGNENYPLFARTPKLDAAPRRPALRRAPRGAAAALGGAAPRRGEGGLR